ncbi:MAG: site-2 protease family protein [Oscillospiraceae bacterium]
MFKKISVGADFFVLLFLLILFCSDELLLLFAAAVIAHEAGHIIALQRCGAAAECVKLRFYGISISYREEKLTFCKNILCAAAGPAASLILALCAGVYGRYFANDGAYLLAGISFVLFAFNMLPVYALDGGRMLFFIFERYLGGKAELILLYTGLAVSLLFILGGLAMCKNGYGNPIIPGAGLIIAVSCCKKNILDVI